MLPCAVLADIEQLHYTERCVMSRRGRLATTGRHERHAQPQRRAEPRLDAGLTISEIKEALVQRHACVGFPRSLDALGEPAERFPRVLRWSPSGQPTSVRLLARRSRGRSSTLRRPSISLQVHLFGDIFERDNLD